MEMLDIIYAKQLIWINAHKIENSLSEIKSKHPNRIDLIQSMEKSEKDLKMAYFTFCELENELRQSKLLAGALTTENLKMINKINLLNDEINNHQDLEKQLIELENENEILKKRLNSLL